MRHILHKILQQRQHCRLQYCSPESPRPGPGAPFERAPYHDPEDPLDRVLAHIEFRRATIAGTAAQFTCLAGTMIQKVHDTSETIREACGRAILGHAVTLIADNAGAPPGLKVPEAKVALLPQLPDELFPAGDKAGRWLKAVPLDLEAKGVIRRGPQAQLPRQTRRHLVQRKNRERWPL